MRVALRQTREVGLRAGRILLGEAALTSLGLFESSLGTGADRRVQHVDDIEGYDVFVSDTSDDPEEDAALAAEVGIPCVLAATIPDPGPDVLCGANVYSGLAPALAEHEVRRTGTPLQVTVATTTRGPRLRKGEAVPFPEPVGPLWARPSSSRRHRRLIASTPDEWMGIAVDVTSASSDGVGSRLVGVADLDVHLEALALAAAGATAVDPGYPADIHDVWWSEAYLARAFAMGLAVATHTSED